MTKRQQFVLDQVKYSQSFFTVSFLSSTQTCTLPKNIFPITPQALCCSLPSSSCSQRHSTAGRKGARGEREHIALNLLSVRDQKQNGRALKAGSGLNYWPSLRLQTSLCLTYPLWTEKVPQKLSPVKKNQKTRTGRIRKWETEYMNIWKRQIYAVLPLEIHSEPMQTFCQTCLASDLF